MNLLDCACPRGRTWAILVLGLSSLSSALAGEAACGTLSNGTGPWDYRVEHNGHIRIVEQFHFMPEVEGLIRGPSGSVGGDLDYTLRASPNHHRALVALQRLAAREHSERLPGMRYSVDCWFERALRYRADDTVARMIFVTHLIATKRLVEAGTQLAVAAEMAGDNPLTHNNLGLLFFEIKDYKAAMRHARQSIALGYPRTELKDKLIQIGEWQDPSAAAGAGSSVAQPSHAASQP